MESGDESAGEPDYFAYLLHKRLGRPGIYLIADQRGDLESQAYQVHRDIGLGYIPSEKPLPQKLHDAIEAFTHAPEAPPSDPYYTPQPPEPERQNKPSAAGLAGQFIKAFLPAVFISGLLLTVLWILGVGIARVVVRRDRIGPRRLRRMARAELVRLARAIGAAGEDNDGYLRAMTDYDAAKLLYDEKQDPGSRFAVVVLALDGQDALKHEKQENHDKHETAARCTANPLHGIADRSVRKRLPGLPNAKYPLCAACQRTTRPLTIKIDGKRIPYYQAPGLWEKIAGRHRDLPERVLEYLGVD
jgi:hypothetical protein